MRIPSSFDLVRPLSLGVTLLLFAQWPLREAGQGAAAALANDAAQLLFALYVALAVPWASRRGAHVALHQGGAAGRWMRVAAALLPLPWCLWLATTAAAPAWRAIAALERFPESFSPGYFVLRAAPLLLATWLAAECLRAAHRARVRS